MALISGSKLDPYEIASLVGAGGTAEVYRTKDTRLDRNVVIRILPLHLSTNPDLKERAALRKLLILDAADRLADLRIPPGNRLEALSGNRKGQHSMRINDQWRICFRWTGSDAKDVEITDYH